MQCRFACLDNAIELYLSEEYLEYGEQIGVTKWIDFTWMKNAFIVDFLAEELSGRGFGAGTISSYDGFARNMDGSGQEFALNLYDRAGDKVLQIATMKYTQPQSMVTLRDFPLNARDKYHYYQLTNGEIRTMYLDIADCKCKSAAASLCSYSTEQSCAEILLKIAPLYIADAMQETALWELGDGGIYSVYCEERMILHNDASLQLADVYASEDVTYTTALRR